VFYVTLIIPAFPSPSGDFGKQQSGTDFGKAKTHSWPSDQLVSSLSRSTFLIEMGLNVDYLSIRECQRQAWGHGPIGEDMANPVLPEEAMARAIALSQEAISQGSGPPFGAVIVRGGTIVGEGFNHVHASKDPTAHAEIVAIRSACEKLEVPFLDGSILYSSSEPCPMCMSAIYWSRISAVHFATDREAAARAGFDDRMLYAELQRPLSERAIPVSQMMAAEGQTTFDIWATDGRSAVQTSLNG